MAEETELKLELDLASVETLRASDLLAGEPSVRQQLSIYFDTVEHHLQQAGYSLRIRKEGATRTQTLKATSARAAGLFARSEWESRVDSDVPVLDHATPLRGELGSIVDRLVPQFEVHIERAKWNLMEGDTQIEMVIDVGTVMEAGRQVPICEVELELKNGPAAGLFKLACKISEIVPVRLGVQSKAERGYDLLGPLWHAHKAETVELGGNSTAASAFQTICTACLRHFRLNETILLERKNDEALHQARVALRRLRSAFSLFKPMLATRKAESLNGEVRWIASILGNARDIDVLLGEAEERALRGKLGEARSDAYDHVLVALNSPRMRALMLDLTEWLGFGEVILDADAMEMGSMPISEFAAAALDRQRRKVKKHAKGFAEADDEHRHQVRKDVKKLRYAAEFFGPLFGTKKSQRRHRRFMEVLQGLQDKLGVLNDLATRSTVFTRLGLGDQTASQGKTSKSRLIEKAENAIEELIDAKRFWR